MVNKNLFVLTFAIFLFVASVLIVSPGTVTGFLARTGQFTLGNEPIYIWALYLNGVECSDSTPTDCTINPLENTTKPVTLKITVQDDNGNCDEFTTNNGTAYFCDTLGQGYCNATNAKHIVTDLEYDAADGQWGSSDEYCNLTATAFNMQFYEVHGNYNVTASVTDGASSDIYPYMWYYNQLSGIVYPATGSAINLGALTLDQWNNGTGQALMQNSGNQILDLDWNATNFTGAVYSDVFGIDGTNFILDDDANSPDDTGSQAQVNISDIPTTTIAYEPATGLLNCSSVACSNTNATKNYYWHELLPAGLHSDTYTDIIQVSTTIHTTMRSPGEGGGSPY